MSSDSTQLKLGQKKKVPKPKITERTAIDHNTWDLPDDVDLIKESIEICELHSSQDVNTFYLYQNKMQWDFAFDDGTLLFTNHPCPGCGKKHNASIDLETAETTQQCLKTNAIFKNVNGKKAVQVQMICPTCNKMHITVDYPTWKTLSDKNCAECQQETAAAKDDTRKKSKKLLKEGEIIKPQIPETTIEEVAEAIEELVPETIGDISAETPMIGPFYLGSQDLGKSIKRLIHPDFDAHFYLTILKDPVAAMSTVHTKIYWENPQVKGDLIVYVMNYQAVNVFQVTSKDITIVNAPIPPMQFTQLDEQWITQLFPDFKKSPRGDKKKEVPLKADNGTREGLPERFEKKEKSPRGDKSEQGKLDQFCTMLINTNKLIEADFQFRDGLDKEHVNLLADSIKSLGKNIESIIVREVEDKYEIIAGHHRVAAAKKAKLTHVKCEVYNVTDLEAVEISLITNFTQKELNPLEEARALKSYQDLSQLSQVDIATKLGKSKQWISYRLSLLDAPIFTQQKLAEEKITASHVEAVSGLTQGDQESIITDAARQKLTVRETERLVKEKKKEYKTQEKLVQAYEDLELYLNDHFDELKDKRISSTYYWNSDKKELIAKHYDLTIDNILSELGHKDYGDPLHNWELGETEERVLGIFAKVGLEVIDGEALCKTDVELETETKKKENLCEACDVPEKFLETRYCPFSEDLSEPKTKCDYVWGRYYSSDDEKFPKDAKKICYICRKEFSEDDFTRRRDNSGRRVHMSCYHEKLVEQGFINYVICEDKDCKRKGSCSLQDELFKDIKRLDYPVVIDLMECEYFKESAEEDKLIFVKRSWYYTLFDDYGSSIDAGESLEDVAQYLKEKGFPIEMLTAVGEDNTSHLNQLLELLQEDKDSKEEESS